MNTPSPAIFLDRDGTLHRDAVYMIRFEDFEPMPGVDEALRRLQKAGYRLFGVTNQSGVARGMFTLEQVRALNAKIQAWFCERGVEIEEIAVCPHHPEGKVAEYARECDCRKPKPGMLLDLAARHNLDLSRSWMVGDALRDAQAGLAAGTRAAIVPPLKNGADVDIVGRFKEFKGLLEFAESIEEGAASHA
ncbi:MAG TPA: HAD family hydrolase [Fibrobacteria bacterium]|jgi:D-glycero-D-manno-heptose 1,7-bisphosphate phosphatase|nr:HAD family hydrolase [Fibrobacteria bacterium]